MNQEDLSGNLYGWPPHSLFNLFHHDPLPPFKNFTSQTVPNENRPLGNQSPVSRYPAVVVAFYYVGSLYTEQAVPWLGYIWSAWNPPPPPSFCGCLIKKKSPFRSRSQAVHICIRIFSISTMHAHYQMWEANKPATFIWKLRHFPVLLTSEETWWFLTRLSWCQILT